MNTALPFASPDSCPAPGGGDCPDPTPMPALGPYSSVPSTEELLCTPAPIIRPGAGCVSVNANLLLSDGTSAKASSISSGIKLIGFSSDGELRAQTVIAAHQTLSVGLRIKHSQGEFVCSETHAVFLTNGETLSAGALEHGSRLLLSEFAESEVLEIEEIGSIPVISITCEPDHTFFSDDVASHNFKVVWPFGDAYL